MNEAQIISDIQRSDPEQYATLVERYHVGLIIHCERIVGDRDQAEDIAQQAFIKAYQQLYKFDPDKGRFSTWLYRIASNCAIDHLRSERKQANIEDYEVTDEDTDIANAALLTEVTDAVQTLQPPEQRQVIEMYYWQGKSYQDIADEMGVPINTIRSYLHRAKEQLRGRLA